MGGLRPKLGKRPSQSIWRAGCAWRKPCTTFHAVQRNQDGSMGIFAFQDSSINNFAFCAHLDLINLSWTFFSLALNLKTYNLNFRSVPFQLPAGVNSTPMNCHKRVALKARLTLNGFSGLGRRGLKSFDELDINNKL